MLLPAHRPRSRAGGRPARRAQGVPRHPGRRHRVRARPGDPRRRRPAPPASAPSSAHWARRHAGHRRSRGRGASPAPAPPRWSCSSPAWLGKSAQSRSTTGSPTPWRARRPRRALIHAATMVAAGTYVLARLLPAALRSPDRPLVLGVLAALTMVWPRCSRSRQSDLKRLLAYSTLSQIAVMCRRWPSAPPARRPTPALHLLVARHVQVAALPRGRLAAVLAGGTAAVALRGGGARLRSTGPVRSVGLLSLAGLPPLVGFLSKEGVLSAAEEAPATPASRRAGSCSSRWSSRPRSRRPTAPGLAAAHPAHARGGGGDRRARGGGRAGSESEVSLAEMFGPVPARAGATAPRCSRRGGTTRPDLRGARRAVWLLVVLTVVGGAVVLTPLLRLDAPFSLWSVGCLAAAHRRRRPRGPPADAGRGHR